MKNYIQIIMTISCALLLFSCTTVKVTKVNSDNDPDGQRYYLGKPFIKVTPSVNGDGTYETELVYLPDENKKYAVASSSFMSKLSLELGTNTSGILNKVALSTDATAIASDAATALGEIAKTEITTRKEEAKKKQDEIDADIKEKKGALKDAKELLDQKRILRATNEREIAVLEATSPEPLSNEVKEKIRTLKNDNFKLDLEIESLQKKISDLTASISGLEGAANIADEKEKEFTAYGPVLFEIKEEVKNGKLSVTLEPVKIDGEIQKKFKTAPKVEMPSAVEPVETKPAPLLLSKKVTVKMNPDKTFSFMLTFNAPVLRIDNSNSYFESDPVVKVNQFTQDPSEDEESITLTTKKAALLKPGKYALKIKYFYDRGGEAKEGSAESTVVFELQK